VTSALQYPFATLPAPGGVIEIRPGVLWVRMPLPMALDHINLYLLEDDHGWWIVDTGLRGDDTQALWEQVFATALGGKPVTGIVCTHCHPDHVGQAGWLSERWRAPLHMTLGEYYTARVFATPISEGSAWEALDFYRRAGAPQAFLDAFARRSKGFSGLVEPLPRSFHRVSAGERLCIGGHEWEAVIGQGHSPEHLCLLDRGRKLLISGDQVIPRITSNVSVLAIEPEANPLEGWLDSHERFLALPDDVLVMPAHNTPFHGLHTRLRALIAHHEHHLHALEQACAAPRTAAELLPVMFRRELGPEIIGMAFGECLAHLHLLRARGLVERELGGDGLYRYRAISDTPQQRLPSGHARADDDPAMEFEGQPI
jgi:glyoxylase-like metal-dependent hydrolase (beta-lactamase superfamily II)